jgi:hypothetical protein
MVERKKRKAKPKTAKQVHVSEPTEPKQCKPWLFQPGQSGNPAGRPKGSRNKLAETFLADMYEAWQTSGADVLSKVIANEPAAFLRSMVSLMPKEMDVNVNRYDMMTDEQLKSQFVAALREARTLGLDLGAGEPASLH